MKRYPPKPEYKLVRSGLPPESQWRIHDHKGSRELHHQKMMQYYAECELIFFENTEEQRRLDREHAEEQRRLDRESDWKRNIKLSIVTAIITALGAGIVTYLIHLVLNSS